MRALLAYGIYVSEQLELFFVILLSVEIMLISRGSDPSKVPRRKFSSPGNVSPEPPFLPGLPIYRYQIDRKKLIIDY